VIDEYPARNRARRPDHQRPGAGRLGAAARAFPRWRFGFDGDDLAVLGASDEVEGGRTIHASIGVPNEQMLDPMVQGTE
jgi:hypothetical protein